MLQTELDTAIFKLTPPPETENKTFYFNLPQNLD